MQDTALRGKSPYSVHSQSKMILPAAFAALYGDVPAPVKTSKSADEYTSR